MWRKKIDFWDYGDDPVLRGYYKTYLDNLFECCEADFAIANGARRQQKLFKEVEVPQGYDSKFYSFEILKSSFDDDRKKIFSKPYYCTFNHCVLCDVECKMKEVRKYLDVEYVIKVKDYIEKYEKLKKQGCDFTYHETSNDDYDDDCDNYVSSLRRDIEDAKEEIYQLIKQGNYSPYKEGYGNTYVSGLHAYLVNKRRELQTYNRKVWDNLPSSLVRDLDYVITKYDVLPNRLKSEYDL